MTLLRGRPKWWQFVAKRRQRDRIEVQRSLNEDGPAMTFQLMERLDMSTGRVYTALLGLQDDGRADRVGKTWMAL